jgi:hypothetical protein
MMDRLSVAISLSMAAALARVAIDATARMEERILKGLEMWDEGERGLPVEYLWVDDGRGSTLLTRCDVRPKTRLIASL